MVDKVVTDQGIAGKVAADKVIVDKVAADRLVSVSVDSLILPPKSQRLITIGEKVLDWPFIKSFYIGESNGRYFFRTTSSEEKHLIRKLKEDSLINPDTTTQEVKEENLPESLRKDYNLFYEMYSSERLGFGSGGDS